jgi:hypothetical protein
MVAGRVLSTAVVARRARRSAAALGAGEGARAVPATV